MRNIVFLLLASMLLFAGCLGGGGTPEVPKMPNVTVQPPSVTVTPGEECTPAYSFSEVTAGKLSQSMDLVATVTCAAGKQLTASVDGVAVVTKSASDNGTTPITFTLVAKKDGTSKVTVSGDSQTLLSKDWKIAPLGSSDTKGPEYDAVSFKEWRAMSVDIANQINVGKVKLFIKRLESRTQPGTYVIVDLRSDDQGKPGQIIASSKKSISDTTLSDNWISFDFDSKPAVSAGKYWVVLRIEQSESVKIVSDTVTWHYVTNSKDLGSGNDYTRQMLLNVDEKTGFASESSWNKLAYDRVYAMTVHAAE